MIGKTWIAMMVGAFVMLGGLATVAAGNMNGDCLQDKDQDRLQLKDGSCQDDLLEDAAATDSMNGDCLQNKTQDRLQDGSCDQCPCDSLAAEDGTSTYFYHHAYFFYSELQDGETPYEWQSQCQCYLI